MTALQTDIADQRKHSDSRLIQQHRNATRRGSQRACGPRSSAPVQATVTDRRATAGTSQRGPQRIPRPSHATLHGRPVPASTPAAGRALTD